MKKKATKPNEKNKKIDVINEIEPAPPSLREKRDNILVSLIARYHISKNSRNLH